MRFLNFFRPYLSTYVQSLFRWLARRLHDRPERTEPIVASEHRGLPDGIPIALEPILYSRPPTPHPSFSYDHMDGGDLALRCNALKG